MMERQMVTKRRLQRRSSCRCCWQVRGFSNNFWLPDGQRQLLLEGGMEYNSLVVVKGKEEADRRLGGKKRGGCVVEIGSAGGHICDRPHFPF